MALLFADPTFWNVVIGIGALALGWLARHKGVVPAPSPPPKPTPPPDGGPLSGLLGGPAGQALVALLKTLLERQQLAEGTQLLGQLLPHLPSTVPPPAAKPQNPAA